MTVKVESDRSATLSYRCTVITCTVILKRKNYNVVGNCRGYIGKRSCLVDSVCKGRLIAIKHVATVHLLEYSEGS